MCRGWRVQHTGSEIFGFDWVSYYRGPVMVSMEVSERRFVLSHAITHSLNHRFLLCYILPYVLTHTHLLTHNYPRTHLLTHKFEGVVRAVSLTHSLTH